MSVYIRVTSIKYYNEMGNVKVKKEVQFAVCCLHRLQTEM